MLIWEKAPFQWAAIFKKTDINFTEGMQGLGWYDSGSKSRDHGLPCKVYCDFCRTPIMDEGRNMILLFPSLIENVHSDRGRRAFQAQCHLFYGQRVVDFKDDGLPKWSGLNDDSTLLDDEGHELKK